MKHRLPDPTLRLFHPPTARTVSRSPLRPGPALRGWIAWGLGVLLTAGSHALLHAQTYLTLANDPGVLELAPAAAFDGTRWLMLLNAGDRLQGRWLDRTGSPLAPPVELGRSRPLPPVAAAAVSQGHFLTVWTDADGSIYGAAGTNSTPLGVLVAGTEASPVQVRGLAGSAEGFLLVFQWPEFIGNLYARFLEPNGQPRGDPVLVMDPPTRTLEDGIELPAVVAGGGAFLVAWQRHDSRLGNAPNVTEAMLVRVGQGGAIPTPVLTVSERASADHNPIAADFDGERFLVVWNHSEPEPTPSTEGLQLHGRWINPATGQVEGPQTSLVAEPTSHFPALAWDGRAHLLLWHHQESGEVRARYFRRDGSPLPTAPTLPTLPRPPGPSAVFPGLQFDGERFLAVLNVLGLELDEHGDVVGFSSGDVFAARLPASPLEPGSPPRLTLRHWSPQTGAELQGTGTPGVVYRLEAAADPAGPWTSLGAAAPAGADGAFTFTDPDTSRPRRFYRAVTP